MSVTVFLLQPLTVKREKTVQLVDICWWLRMGFIGGLGSVGLMVGLEDHRVLFQHKWVLWFYDAFYFTGFENLVLYEYLSKPSSMQ